MEIDSILDEISDSVIIRDLDNRIVSWNRVSEHLYGYTKTQAAGQALHDLLKSHHPTTVESLETHLMANGSWDGELSRTGADGRPRRVEVKWRLRDGRIIEHGRDLTALSDLEHLSRETSFRYTNLFQAMAAAFWELDFSEVRKMMSGLFQSGISDFPAYFRDHPEFIDAAIAATRVVDVNDKCVEMFAAPDREAMIGGNIDPYWPPESRHVFAESLIASATRAPSLTTETRVATLDGRKLDVLFTVCWPKGHHGRGTVLVGNIDISDRKAAEAELQRSEIRYRTLFQAMSTALFELDTTQLLDQLETLRQDGVTDIEAYFDAHPDFLVQAMDATLITEVNEAALRIFGAQDRRELIGLSVRHFWPPSGLLAFRQALSNAFNNGEGFEMETRNLRLDGREIDVLFSLNASPVLRARKRVLIGLTDISERVAAQKAVQQLQTEFAHASRLSVLGELVASIAHEVNQPLAAIAANGAAATRWLSRAEPDLDEVRSINTHMIGDAKRAADIIARVRTMAANQTPVYARIDLNHAIEDALTFLGHELQAHGARVNVDLSPDLKPVNADRVQIQQIIVNLVLNALQEMARAQVDQRLEIRSFVNGNTAQIEISDNGPGITPENMERLFNSFFTTKSSGLGMGLSICKTILEAHGGRIWAHNQPSGGACFAFCLPFAED